MTKYSLNEVKKSLHSRYPIMHQILPQFFSILWVWFSANFIPFIHPNIHTILAFILRIFAVFALLNQMFITCAILALISHIIDHADGALARTLNKPSKLGAIIDHTLDGIAFSLLFLSTIIILFKLNKITESFLVLITMTMYLIRVKFREVYETYKPSKSKDSGKSFYDSIKMQPFAFIANITKRFRFYPYTTFVETYLILFVIAPVFNYNIILVFLALLMLIPEFLIYLYRLLSITHT